MLSFYYDWSDPNGHFRYNKENIKITGFTFLFKRLSVNIFA